MFVRYVRSSFAYTTPFPPRPKTPFTYVIYLYSDILLPKGHLGSRGGKHLKQTEGRQFHLCNDKRHNLKYISYACAEGIPQSLEMKGTYIINILALLLFENLQMICLNSRLNGTQPKDVKWGVGVEGASFHGFVNDESL